MRSHVLQDGARSLEGYCRDVYLSRLDMGLLHFCLSFEGEETSMATCALVRTMISDIRMILTRLWVCWRAHQLEGASMEG